MFTGEMLLDRKEGRENHRGELAAGEEKVCRVITSCGLARLDRCLRDAARCFGGRSKQWFVLGGRDFRRPFLSVSGEERSFTSCNKM
eukprot:825259-Pyramimonas_sp.AAC.1